MKNLAIVAAIIALLFMGCISSANGPDAQSDATADSEPGQDPQPSEPDDKPESREITISASPARIDFDPLHAYSSTECQLYTAIYEGLVSYHPFTLEPLPGLAQNWDISEDGLTYTFYLRDGLYFSNGDRLTASDIRDSWLRMVDPDKKAEYSVFFEVIKGVKEYRRNREGGTDSIAIKAQDDKTIEITLEKPASHFLKLLCHMSFVPIHELLRGYDDWGIRGNIVANGPFHIIERNPQKIVLAKNKLYWDAHNVEIERLVFLFSNDRKELAQLFNSGTVQWSFNADVELIKDRTALVLNPMFSTSYFFFRCDSQPFNESSVRRGLALLLPWSDIRIKEYLFTAETLVPRLTGYPEVNGIAKQDVEEGLKLLRSAGYAIPDADGKPTNGPEIMINISDDEDTQRVAGIMKKTWEDQCGAKVTVKANESEEYFSSIKSAEYTIGIMSWIGDFADPLTFLQMWTSDSNLNDARYKNGEFDDLVDRSMRENDEKKYELLASAERILLDSAVILPIKRHPAFNIVDLHKIEGWYPNPLDIHPFKYLRYKEDEILPNMVLGNKHVDVM